MIFVALRILGMLRRNWASNDRRHAGVKQSAGTDEKLTRLRAHERQYKYAFSETTSAVLRHGVAARRPVLGGGELGKLKLDVVGRRPSSSRRRNTGHHGIFVPIDATVTTRIMLPSAPAVVIEMAPGARILAWPLQRRSAY